MKITFFVLVPIIMIISSCSSQTKRLSKNEFNNNYKFNSEISQILSTDSINPNYQSAAISFSAKGDYKNALLNWDMSPMFKPKIKTYPKDKIDSINNRFKVILAKDYILEQSNKNKIIIINEFHHNATHRVLTESLLQNLFDNGYKNLCLEALNNGSKEDTLLNKRKYPIQSSGYYIKNPQFGNLVRTALKIGYKLFPYETTQKIGGEPREVDQANNIKKIIDDRPNEKFLIQCGSGHALEGDVRFFGGLALAERIHKLTGINPLTVDQVYYSEKSKAEYNSPIFKAIDVKKPSILLDKNNFPFSYKNGASWIDIVVFHPNTEYINNRPNWLINDQSKLVQIELDNIDLNFPVMIMAFNSNEDFKHAIPVDILEVEHKKNASFLALQKGKFTIVIVNQTGEAMVLEKKIK